MAYGTATALAGRRVPGYRHVEQPISALAAHGSAGAVLMVPGFCALGVGSLSLARALGNDPSLRRVAPVVATSGIAATGAGLARCSSPACPSPIRGDDVEMTDVLHTAFSIPAFLAWVTAPLVAATAATGSRRYGRQSALLGTTALASYVMLRRAARQDSPAGLLQRLTISIALAWEVLTALELGRRPTTA